MFISPDAIGLFLCLLLQQPVVSFIAPDIIRHWTFIMRDSISGYPFRKHSYIKHDKVTKWQSPKCAHSLIFSDFANFATLPLLSHIVVLSNCPTQNSHRVNIEATTRRYRDNPRQYSRVHRNVTLTVQHETLRHITNYTNDGLTVSMACFMAFIGDKSLILCAFALKTVKPSNRHPFFL